MNSRNVIIAMLGARMHYAVPRILHEAGILERFYTDIYLGNKPVLLRILERLPSGYKNLNKLKGRSDDSIPPEKVISFDLFGVIYWWKQKRAKNIQELHHVFAEGGKRFCERIIKSGIGKPDIIYGFQSASLELFKYAKEKGIKCVLEQTIAPQRIQRMLLKEEVERWPGWQDNIDYPSENDPLAQREKAEWELADLILAGSKFVVDGLKTCGVVEEKCRVVPYGVPLEQFHPPTSSSLIGDVPIPVPSSLMGDVPSGGEQQGRKPINRPLRVLFIGEVGLRKGVPYLLEALRMLNTKNIEARLIGKISIAEEIVKRYQKYATFYGTIPRNQIKEHYAWADVFVLPSICEGSATVTYEALASGIPVVCTPNTGSVVRDGVDGHIVAIRDSEAMAEVLENYLKNPALLMTQQKNVIEGRKRVGVNAYKERVVESVSTLV